MVREKADIYLVSDMDPSVVEKTILKPAGNLKEAFEAAAAGRTNPTVIAMPYGGSTLPKLIEK
jgi:hypothetical protein